MRAFLRWFALAAVVFALAAPILLQPLTGWRLIVVDGGSMEPTYHYGDVLITRAPSGDDLRMGAIIVAGTAPGLYTHRVVDLVASAAGTRAQLRGDANSVNDPGLISEKDVYAVPVAAISGTGARVMTAITSLAGRMVLIALALFLLLLWRRERTAPHPAPSV